MRTLCREFGIYRPIGIRKTRSGHRQLFLEQNSGIVRRIVTVSVRVRPQGGALSRLSFFSATTSPPVETQQASRADGKAAECMTIGGDGCRRIGSGSPTTKYDSGNLALRLFRCFVVPNCVDPCCPGRFLALVPMNTGFIVDGQADYGNPPGWQFNHRWHAANDSSFPSSGS
jgi:hypothetical protein